MSKIYQDGTYLAKNSTWHEEDSPYKAKWINKLIKKNSLDPNTICEIGCGSGQILDELSDVLDIKASDLINPKLKIKVEVKRIITIS